MITIHWLVHDDETEIHSGSILEPSGKLRIKVQRGSVDMKGYNVEFHDPFGVVLEQKTLPSLDKDDKFSIIIPVTHYLPKGKYKILVNRPDGSNSMHFEVEILSRKQQRQVFLAENKLRISGMGGKIDLVSLNIEDLPENIFLQAVGDIITKNNTNFKDNENEITANGLLGMGQKTLKWSYPVQPSFLPVDTKRVEGLPDEYYVLEGGFSYQDEVGLEVSLLEEKDELDADIKYPLSVVGQALELVHDRLRYVKQSKERGLNYALKYNRGDCTEFSALFIALLRSAGIGAKLISGMSRSYYNNWISHAFAEVYLYGSWIPVDVVKPPNPYLQIGNRGDLIGFSRKNWLDPMQKDYSLNISTMDKSRQPTIEFERKVTESGYKDLGKELKREQPWYKYLSKPKKINIERTRDHIIIQSNMKNVQTYLLIQGTETYGSIVTMAYGSEGSLPIPEQIELDNVIVVAVDSNGKIMGKSRLFN